MTDHFAVLAQPRRPWLEPEALQEIFHAQTLRAHPDATGAEDGAFAEVNEAYQVLRDPKRRLQHLLELEGAPRASATVPAELEALFPSVAAVTQQTEAALQKAHGASSALSRSLGQGDLLHANRALEEMQETLSALHQRALDDLRAFNSHWKLDSPNEMSALHDLYLRFSYLDRWRAELQEKHSRLAEMLP